MTSVLWLMLVQGAFGAFDTAYYHEYRARLVAGGARTRSQLWLHALRDWVYAILFFSLPLVAWCGAWALGLAALIAFEIVVTMADFAVETRTRGVEGVAPGERITHGMMAIVYGAMLGRFLPELLAWHQRATGITPIGAVPPGLRAALLGMAVGVFASGLRDATPRWADATERFLGTLSVPIVKAEIVISALPEAVFELAQNYELRLRWDPFLRALEQRQDSDDPKRGDRVWVRSWTGLTMEVEYVNVQRPHSVAMRMLRGPWFFELFAGTWLFHAHPPAATRVVFQYNFRTRPRAIRLVLDPLIQRVFQRDVQARLAGLKRGMEVDRLLESVGR